MMIDFATSCVLKIRKWSFFRAAAHTLAMLMPIAVLGSYFKLLNSLVFSPDGLIYNIFALDQIMPDRFWYAGQFVSRGIVEITFGVFGLYASYFMARYTARLYQRDETMAGLTAVLVLLFCSYAASSGQGAQVQFASSVLQVNAVFVALIVGYCVGQVFHWLGYEYEADQVEKTKWIQHRSARAVWPLTVSLAVGIALGVVIYELQIKMLNSASFAEIINRMQTTNNLAEILPLTVIVTFLNWLGIGFPLSTLTGPINNAFTAENLTYTLQHGDSWTVPYKYLGHSLLTSYGIMGGASVVLAVIVLLLLRPNNKEVETIARFNLLPAAFNSTLGFSVGLPLILNPVFLVPSVLVPLINIVLAAGAISLHVIPVSVYPILKGTPGILLSFFGTNGSWSALTFTIALFLLDLGLLWPVIKVNERVAQVLNEESGGGQHA